MGVQILACCSPTNAKSDIAFVCFCYFHVYQRLDFETLTLVTLALKLSAAPQRIVPRGWEKKLTCLHPLFASA